MILVILFKFRASVASDINLLITLHVYVMLTSVRQTASAPDSGSVCTLIYLKNKKQGPL